MNDTLSWEILGGVWVSGDTVTQKDVLIENGKITELTVGKSGSIRIELDGHFVYPGLWNSHDHLIASYLPKVTTTHKHSSWLSYDNEVKSSPIFAERQKLGIEELYYLGAYKNAFSGVTRVVDHIPHFVQEPFRNRLPIELVYPYSLSHSICSYSLNWGIDPHLEYQMAKEGGYAYITHIAEGFDDESRGSLKKLDRMGALGEHSVLVHGLSFSGEDLEIVAEKKAKIVWCPSSNYHIFRKTSPIDAILRKKIPVCLGTDGSTSGGLNLFEEMRFARRVYSEVYGKDLSPAKILDMVTKTPAHAFFQNSHLGSLESGMTADLVVLEKQHSDPYENLLIAEPSQILALAVAGEPRILGDKLKDFAQELGQDFEEILIGNQKKLVFGSPNRLIKAVRDRVGDKKSLAFFPIALN